MARGESPVDSTIASDLEKVLEAGNRAKGLIQQILAFSRQAAPEPIALQPAGIVREAINMLRPSLLTTIDIYHDIAAKTGLIIADPTQINQILMNLCTNAYHAMEETGGRLGVSLQEVLLDGEDTPCISHLSAGRYVEI